MGCKASRSKQIANACRIKVCQFLPFLPTDPSAEVQPDEIIYLKEPLERLGPRWDKSVLIICCLTRRANASLDKEIYHVIFSSKWRHTNLLFSTPTIPCFHRGDEHKIALAQDQPKIVAPGPHSQLLNRFQNCERNAVSISLIRGSCLRIYRLLT
jgi:hypothetical protein